MKNPKWREAYQWIMAQKLINSLVGYFNEYFKHKPKIDKGGSGL